MEQNTQLGRNKTGIDMSPFDSKEMIEASEESLPDPFDAAADDRYDKAEEQHVTASDPGAEMGSETGTEKDLNHGQGNGHSSWVGFERSYLEDADPLGSVPIPGTAKGTVKSALKKATGKRPEVFFNKLGERLAYERSGVRIYEQLIAKCEYGDRAGRAETQIPLERLKEFRDQEAEHFLLVVNAMHILGADPTAVTPDADMMGLGASGLMKVIADPRTSVSQSMEAMLAIELTDNAAWELLIKLAEDMGLTDMVQDFSHALKQEQVHLTQVRQWVEECVRGQVS
ncbi:MAG: ferritin-like domain-containing protein [Natronospirillum sp.]